MRNVILGLILLASATAVASSQGEIDITIRPDLTPAVRIAVPVFVADSGDAKAASLAETFNTVLWDDLDYSGPVLLASRSFYPKTVLRSPGDIKPEEWTRPGLEAKYIVFGTIRMNGGEFSVNAQLHDVRSTARVFGNRYVSRNATDRTVRRIAHRFADEILENLGYGRGVAQTEIAFVCDRAGNGVKEICVMDYDGQNSEPITAIGNLALTPSWSPDSKKIAYLSYRDGTNIEIVNRADLRRLQFPHLGGMNTTPSWSKDGSHIAFASSSRDPKSGTRIVVADADGKNVRELTRSTRSDVSPVWNPATGREIIFSSDRPPSAEGVSQLYAMDAEGTNVRLLGKAGGASYSPSWSPDGLLVAFSWQQSGPGNRRDIWVLNLRTGQTGRLTGGDGDNDRPSWAPDGRHIV
ncbi:MAG TPA: hypothetical protein VFY29_07395, partial [Terriglobia bacterium]|nr:hypothetical protein [Terriglobia bacterium]